MRSSSMRNRVLLAIGALILVGAYVGGRGGSPTPAEVRPAPVATVQWADYAPGLQTRIVAMANAKDCDGLQSEFDVADANNAATLDRTGHNNAELMAFIDASLREAGCY